MKAVDESLLASALRAGAEHRARQVDANDIPAHASQRERVPPRTATKVENTPAPQPPQLFLRKPYQDRVRR